MKHLCFICIILLMFACDGCGKKKHHPAFYEPEIIYVQQEQAEEPSAPSYVDDEEDVSPCEEIVSIPFYESNGVKYVDVKLNNSIGVEMILDSGCSCATISVSEAEYLYNKGVLTEDDLETPQESRYADGRVELNQVVNLRELCIGGKISCRNVKATIIDNPQVPLLLGNDVLDRVASYEVDNQNRVINFKINQ